MAAFRAPRGEIDRAHAIVLPVLITLLAMSALSILAWRTRRPALTLAVFASFSLSLVTVDFSALRSYAEASSSRAVARSVEQALARETPSAGPAATRGGEIPVAGLEWFPTGLPFYLRHTVFLITRRGGELTSNYVLFTLRHESAWPEGLIRYEQRDAWLTARTTPVYLLAGRKGLGELRRIASARGAAVDTIRDGTWGALLAAPASR
jgi:hypothetical protein